MSSLLHMIRNGFKSNDKKNFKEIFSEMEPAEALLYENGRVARVSYPIESLGSVMKSAVESLSVITQAPEALAAQSILSASALVAQQHVSVQFDNRVHPVSLFSLTIARSGERKSTVDKLALRSHLEYQKKLYMKYQMEESFEAGPPQIICEEPTWEGLQASLRCGYPSMGLFSDEGGQFVGGMGMSKDNRQKTTAGLSKLWDGGTITRTRSTKGESAILADRKLSCHLMLQPVIANDFVNDDILFEQGFLGRFLLSSPESQIGERVYKKSDEPDWIGLRQYWKRIEDLYSINYVKSELGGVIAKPVPVSDEAVEVAIRYYNSVEIAQKKGGRYYKITPAASKSLENLLRISCVIELMQGSGMPSSISKDSVEGAAVLMDYYLNQILAIRYDPQESNELKAAEGLRAWMEKRGNPEIVLAEILQFGPTKTRKKAAALRALELLHEKRWVISLDEKTWIYRC